MGYSIRHVFLPMHYQGNRLAMIFLTLWNRIRINKKYWGVEWTCGAPLEDYQYEVRSESMECKAIHVVDAPDERYAKLLEWLHQYHVHKVPGKLVQAYEGPSFLVRDYVIESAPKWRAVISVFSFWEQEDQEITFQLSDAWIKTEIGRWKRKKMWDEACTDCIYMFARRVACFYVWIWSMYIYIYIIFRFFGQKITRTHT